MNSTTPTVFIVDDDPEARTALTRLIQSFGMDVRSFASAEEFLRLDPLDIPAAVPRCLLLDLRMPGLNGLDLQRELLDKGQDIPIVFLTGYGSVPETVRAMKAGAADFLEKTVDERELIAAIWRALRKYEDTRDKERELWEIRHKLSALSPREKEILDQVVAGRLNKEIAYELGITERTVKAHRANIMKKMKADSLAELVRMADKAERHRQETG